MKHPGDQQPEEIELLLPLDIPVSIAPRTNPLPLGRAAPHSLLARAQTRLVVLSAGFCGLFLLVALRLVDATLLQPAPDLADASEPNPNAVMRPVRADITDRNGQQLATSLPTKSLYADPKRILDPVAAAHALVKVMPDLKYDEVLDKLTSSRRFVWLKRNLTPDEIYHVNAIGQPGLEFQDDYVRIYPAGASTVHVVGTTDVDGRGLSGIERGLEQRLAQGGKPIALSIDLRLQHIMERELQQAMTDFTAYAGTGIIMDIKTGEVLAAVSLPDYSPTNPGGATDDERFNRFSLGTYELGSVMKVVNTAAALESGKITLNDFFDASRPLVYGRFTINDYHAVHRALSVAETFVHSSNIASARMAMVFGTTFQREFICRIGLCAALKTEIPEAGTPQLPATFRELNGMTIAFGHGISITPLHLVRAAATMLNGGHLLTPTFLQQEPMDTPPGAVVISAKTVDQMRRVMRANVVHPEGSGRSADVPGYFVGGKTGTADKNSGHGYNENARISSFLGAFPMNDPRYVILAVVDEPHANAKSYGFATGGWVSAPIIGHVVAQMAPLLGIPPQSMDDPNVTNATKLTVLSQDKTVETQ